MCLLEKNNYERLIHNPPLIDNYPQDYFRSPTYSVAKGLGAVNPNYNYIWDKLITVTIEK